MAEIYLAKQSIIYWLTFELFELFGKKYWGCHGIGIGVNTQGLLRILTDSDTDTVIWLRIQTDTNIDTDTNTN